MHRFLVMLITAVALSVASPAQAHSALKTSTPSDKSTVSDPKALNLTFTRELRLVTVKLTSDDVDDVVLPVDRAAPLNTAFSFALPSLAPSTYTVRWTARAQDGHIMKGKFTFTVEQAKS